MVSGVRCQVSGEAPSIKGSFVGDEKRKSKHTIHEITRKGTTKSHEVKAQTAAGAMSNSAEVLLI